MFLLRKDLRGMRDETGAMGAAGRGETCSDFHYEPAGGCCQETAGAKLHAQNGDWEPEEELESRKPAERKI